MDGIRRFVHSYVILGRFGPNVRLLLCSVLAGWLAISHDTNEQSRFSGDVDFLDEGYFDSLL
jgi:hypothetical protein